MPAFAVAPYNPTQADLTVTAADQAQRLASSFNPLDYKLTVDDYQSFRFGTKTLYALKPDTGNILWWTLNRLRLDILRAYARSIGFPEDQPILPSFSIPLEAFEGLNLERPIILDLTDFASVNPLFCITTKQNIDRFWAQLQSVGRHAFAWILEAQRRASGIAQVEWRWDDLAQP